MSIPPREADNDDAGRLALVQTELARRMIAALRAAGIPPGHADARLLRQLIRLDLERIADEDRDLLRGLAWRWRRRLPPALAPKLPPHDPLVRAMENTTA